MMEDTYMQPHLHPGAEKVEKMYLIQGKFAVLLFNEKGDVEKVSILEKGDPLVTGMDGVNAVKVAEAVILSLEKGSKIEIN